MAKTFNISKNILYFEICKVRLTKLNISNKVHQAGKTKIEGLIYIRDNEFIS